MGWWRTNTAGASLLVEETGMIWGDGPADALDFAFDYIIQSYQERLGRKPTVKELEDAMTACVTYGWNSPQAKAERPESMDDACMMTLQDAYRDIGVQFSEADWDRGPTLEEMISGVRFSAAILDEDL